MYLHHWRVPALSMASETAWTHGESRERRAMGAEVLPPGELLCLPSHIQWGCASGMSCSPSFGKGEDRGHHWNHEQVLLGEVWARHLILSFTSRVIQILPQGNQHFWSLFDLGDVYFIKKEIKGDPERAGVAHRVLILSWCILLQKRSSGGLVSDPSVSLSLLRRAGEERNKKMSISSY